MTKPGPEELCLRFLKADALIIGAAGKDPELPAWLQKHPLEELNPGNADALFLLDEKAPENLADLLAGLELLAGGGILIFKSNRAMASALADPGLSTGIKVLYHDDRLGVLEKERQFIKQPGGIAISLGFICSDQPEYSFANAHKSIQAWLEFLSHNFRPEVFDLLIVNDRQISNEEQHLLDKSIRLIHHYRPCGKSECLQSIVYNSSARYVFLAQHLMPEQSWPLLHTMLAAPEADFLEAVWPAESGRKHPYGGVRRIMSQLKRHAGFTKSKALSPPAFALSRKIAFELAGCDLFQDSLRQNQLEKIKATMQQIEIIG